MTFDANCCINLALHLGTFQGQEIRSYYREPLRGFLRKCFEIGIPTIHFPFIKEETYRNVTKAVNDLAQARGIPSYYSRSKMLERATNNLDTFFAKVPEIVSNVSVKEIAEARKLFVDNEVDVTRKLNLQRPKQNIPEDNDLRLLVSASKMQWNSAYVISDDGHFVAYEDVIGNSSYKVQVLPMKEIIQRCSQWGWRL